MTFKAQLEIDDDKIAMLLSAAWEGGSNYWARAEGTPYSWTPDAAKPEWRLELPVTVIDCEEGSNKHALDEAAIQRGISLAYKFPAVLAALTADGHGSLSWDAADADVFLQLCLFGEVLYG
jgi:hypothetical protein